MPRSLGLPTLAILTVAGSALGVQLGRGTVDHIKPFWFTDPGSSGFFADLAAQKPVDSAPGPRGSPEVPITSCTGCINWVPPGQTRYAPAVALSDYDARWNDRYDPPAAKEEAYSYVPAEEAPDPDRERVVRYASYSVSDEPAPADEQPAPEEQPAEEPAGSH